MPIRIGLYDKRIRFFPRVDAQNAAGETTSDYPVAQAFDRWASVTEPRAKQIVLNAQEVERTQFAISVRYDPKVNEDCRILYRGRTLEIDQLMIQGRNEEIQLVAVEVV